MSNLEATLAMQLLVVGVPEPEREYRFHPIRRWRFDFAWPDRLLAVEVEGGGWSGGRHTRCKGFASDMVKYSEAMRLGWTVYRCDGGLIQSGEAITAIETILARLPIAHTASRLRTNPDAPASQGGSG
ncbi:hypothetical protein A8L45_08045 [Veronia pacifica]|uniref:DUF559 domain-containing protein n=1 Tax=Veronia pacifica TaxID=1080227 RepID=A0A1C3EL68_9GAMM|nr:hypothetical protein A8L45_08045 [Veronia pacifica]